MHVKPYPMTGKDFKGKRKQTQVYCNINYKRQNTLLLISGFQGAMLLMLIKFLGSHTAWRGVMMPTFCRYMLRVKRLGVCDCVGRKERENVGLLPHD
jgi:hypothetical protein